MISVREKYIKLNKKNRIYNLEIPIIGLSGGIATGKTTAAKLLKDCGISVVNADQVIKNIYGNKNVLNQIEHLAPSSIEAGEINFKKLRSIFFNDEQIKLTIEKILFSHFEEYFKKSVEQCLGKNTFILYDVPLLFEKNLQNSMDLTVIVYTSPEIQIQRLTKRDKIDIELAQKMIASQMSIDTKKNLADVVINNNFDLLNLEKEIDKFKDKYLTFN